MADSGVRRTSARAPTTVRSADEREVRQRGCSMDISEPPRGMTTDHPARGAEVIHPPPVSRSGKPRFPQILRRDCPTRRPARRRVRRRGQAVRLDPFCSHLHRQPDGGRLERPRLRRVHHGRLTFGTCAVLRAIDENGGDRPTWAVTSLRYCAFSAYTPLGGIGCRRDGAVQGGVGMGIVGRAAIGGRNVEPAPGAEDDDGRGGVIVKQTDRLRLAENRIRRSRGEDLAMYDCRSCVRQGNS